MRASIIERPRQAYLRRAMVQPWCVLQIGRRVATPVCLAPLVRLDLPSTPDLLEQRIGRPTGLASKAMSRSTCPGLEDSAQATLLDRYDRGLTCFATAALAGYLILTTQERFLEHRRAAQRWIRGAAGGHRRVHPQTRGIEARVGTAFGAQLLLARGRRG